ncbi:MAG: TatD family hydrolase [Candidatus Chisholmbacteria bacterium]|nr:TatD family hydrolase [Candidatus Chisholmbacteria bacterium]
MLIDTHTHLNFQSFENDWEEVVKRAKEAGVEKMIVVGVDIESSEKAVKMAAENPALYATVGVHPHHVRGLMEEILRRSGTSQSSRSAQDDTTALKSLAVVSNELKKLARNPKVVAVGEVGLDYHLYRKSKYSYASPAGRQIGRSFSQAQNQKSKIKNDIGLKNLQKQLLGMQVELAKELDLPLILHSREAGRDVLDVVEHFSKKDGVVPKGVWHCFDGSKSYLEQILVAGFYVSFTGQVTYVADRAAVALEVPLDRLLLETDCPFMKPKNLHLGGVMASQAQPATVRGDRSDRSEPKDVAILAAFHAEQRGVETATIEAATTKNTNKLFKLGT